MNRRGFLELLAGVSASAVMERLLWVPGKKTIFIPKPVVAPPIAAEAWYYYDAAALQWYRIDVQAPVVFVDRLEDGNWNGNWTAISAEDTPGNRIQTRTATAISQQPVPEQEVPEAYKTGLLTLAV